VTYSEITDDISLRIKALGRLAWVYSSSNQRKMALEKALHMQALFQQNQTKLTQNVQSYVYGVLAKNQALSRQSEAAQHSLQIAHRAFFASRSSETDPSIKHDAANFLLDDSVTHLSMAQPEQALQTLTNFMRIDDLSPQIPLSKRLYPEIVNHLTLTLLK